MLDMLDPYGPYIGLALLIIFCIFLFCMQEPPKNRSHRKSRH